MYTSHGFAKVIDYKGHMREIYYPHRGAGDYRQTSVPFKVFVATTEDSKEILIFAEFTRFQGLLDAGQRVLGSTFSVKDEVHYVFFYRPKDDVMSGSETVPTRILERVWNAAQQFKGT